jgi:DNA-directed RNA polymerase I subunit RPA43
MLSLQGSIQADPFSPQHVAQIDATRRGDDAETGVDKIERELEEVSEEDTGSDGDTFKLLGQKAAQAAAADKKKRRKGQKE